MVLFQKNVNKVIFSQHLKWKLMKCVWRRSTEIFTQILSIYMNGWRYISFKMHFLKWVHYLYVFCHSIWFGKYCLSRFIHFQNKANDLFGTHIWDCIRSSESIGWLSPIHKCICMLLCITKLWLHSGKCYRISGQQREKEQMSKEEREREDCSHKI